MKLEGLKSNLFEKFESDAVSSTHLFIGGIYPTNSDNKTYNNDHCGTGSENSATCADGFRDDLGTADAVR